MLRHRSSSFGRRIEVHMYIGLQPKSINIADERGSQYPPRAKRCDMTFTPGNRFSAALRPELTRTIEPQA
jgi:hypothetical protein